MSEPSELLTKREFLEMTGLILKEILNPRMLRSSLEIAAAKLNIPDADNLVAGMLALGNGAAMPEKAGRGRDATDKKEKGKRGVTTYNMLVCWISDFAAHFGRHPTIAKLKAENPTIKMGMTFCSEFYKTIPQEKKDAVMEVFKAFLKEHLAKGEAEASGSILDAFKKYEAEHPEANIAKIVGLEARDDYKTDPAQMRLEAAEARRHADGGGPSATPLTAIAKLDFGNGDQPNGGGPEGAPTPAVGLKSDGKETDKDKAAKRKAENGPGGAAAGVGGQLEGGSAQKKKKQKLNEDGEGKPKKDKKDKEPRSEVKGEEKAPATEGKDSAVKSEKKKKHKGDKSEQKQKDKGDKSERKSKEGKRDKSVQQ